MLTTTSVPDAARITGNAVDLSDSVDNVATHNIPIITTSIFKGSLTCLSNLCCSAKIATPVTGAYIITDADIVTGDAVDRSGSVDTAVSYLYTRHPRPC